MKASPAHELHGIICTLPPCLSVVTSTLCRAAGRTPGLSVGATRP